SNGFVLSLVSIRRRPRGRPPRPRSCPSNPSGVCARMDDVLNVIWMGVKDAFLMAWEVWWALVLGFAISAIVQAWVPRERIEAALAGSGPKPVTLATALGAASSSCSYAAIAIAKSLFE